jgi:hypothetical protein
MSADSDNEINVPLPFVSISAWLGRFFAIDTVKDSCARASPPDALSQTEQGALLHGLLVLPLFRAGMAVLISGFQKEEDNCLACILLY